MDGKNLVYNYILIVHLCVDRLHEQVEANKKRIICLG